MLLMLITSRSERITSFPQQIPGKDVGLSVGGPPFVRLQQLRRSGAAAIARYKREFRTARSGQFDLYILFMEKAIDLLAANGWLRFSVSNTLLRSETGRVLRRLVGEKCHVHEILEFTLEFGELKP